MEVSYLGDAVYASFDGYHVLLHVNHHENPPAVALEPEVIKALVKYQEKCFNQKIEKLKID